MKEQDILRRMAEIEQELANTPEPQPIISDRAEGDLDNYQEVCEYDWHKKDLLDEYAELSMKIGFIDESNQIYRWKL